MENLSHIGRIFFGISIAVMGVVTIYYRDFPYMLIPPKHSWIPDLVVFVFGAFLVLSGMSIVFQKNTREVSLLLGTVFLAIFCFYFIPYQLIASPNYLHFGDWENAAKELTLSGGALVIAGCFVRKNENMWINFLERLIPFGTIFFAVPIMSYGVNHYLYAKAASEYVPSWVPYPMFWNYVAGTALLSSGVAIILKIKVRLATILLGAMICTWFVVLHTPRVIDSSAADLKDEITSAFLALAYGGIAWVISGHEKAV